MSASCPRAWKAWNDCRRSKVALRGAVRALLTVDSSFGCAAPGEVILHQPPPGVHPAVWQPPRSQGMAAAAVHKDGPSLSLSEGAAVRWRIGPQRTEGTRRWLRNDQPQPPSDARTHEIVGHVGDVVRRREHVIGAEQACSSEAEERDHAGAGRDDTVPVGAGNADRSESRARCNRRAERTADDRCRRGDDPRLVGRRHQLRLIRLMSPHSSPCRCRP